ncbi:MAG: hypothetical protein UX91_C0007G0036 [Candidatus Amesbacteria bacterium GW2011_GWB1_47_19]|nr:MAG: hypothetical protein UW51_C0006G0143 [Candidatus Amesbacteria bacterium GW2011_GWA1_44_24]KKU31820.1 MAG: hypothetical protein UX46_C0002G0036 [Candidatus Amesbacteria bacterium GW2011_GWC1_46_24]KKU66756.1 MAG: hypothetical protein UX91_C0007G0036 [Candidatus Amesbacteria bacterium GW2011_GWB1_47_19]
MRSGQGPANLDRTSGAESEGGLEDEVFGTDVIYTFTGRAGT